MEVVKDENERVPLLDEEAGAMLAFSVAAQALNRERAAYEHEIVAKRLGVHPSRLAAFNAKERWISIRPEPPKQE